MPAGVVQAAAVNGQVRPSAPSPPEIMAGLWEGFGGEYGWDVGANCGQSVIPMQMHFTRFTGFEPCQASFEFAREHFPFADIRPLALSNVNDEVELARKARTFVNLRDEAIIRLPRP